jgi:hypothetical protein
MYHFVSGGDKKSADPAPFMSGAFVGTVPAEIPPSTKMMKQRLYALYSMN